ncbi:hypothetical protein A5709_15270 [Mycobacterium sp. E1386]|nr:hypothetical protein A5709_15270 [Mycobacterium sp. E1386]
MMISCWLRHLPSSLARRGVADFPARVATLEAGRPRIVQVARCRENGAAGHTSLIRCGLLAVEC